MRGHNPKRVRFQLDKKFTDVKTIFSLDVRSLSLFRILLAVTLILDTLNRIYRVPEFYSDHGIVPRELVNLGQFDSVYHFQLMFLSGNEWFSYLFLGILLVCSVLLLIGFKTRITTFICWLLLCSVIIRDPLTTHAGDTLLIVLLLWSLFLPLGNWLSLDSYRNKHQKYRTKQAFSAATIAMYVQISLVYIMSGIFKSNYDSWTSGEHLYNTLSRFDFVEPLAFVIYPYEQLLNFLTHFTLYLELFGPLLFFIPVWFLFFRVFGIFLFVILQISIGLTMDVGLFPLVSSAGVLVFYQLHYGTKSFHPFINLVKSIPVPQF